MKYNLENRPDSADMVEVDKWFEGFEAELREKLEHNHKARGLYWVGVNAMIKEILGE